MTGIPVPMQDAVNNDQCEAGELPFADPEDDQCLDPMALNYNLVRPRRRRWQLSVSCSNSG